MDRCIPKVNLATRQNKLITQGDRKSNKKRNYYYRKSKRHGRLEDFERYKSLQNSVVSMLRQIKANPDFSRNWIQVRVNRSGRPLSISVKTKLNFQRQEWLHN